MSSKKRRPLTKMERRRKSDDQNEKRRDPVGHEQYLFHSAKSRAKKLGIPFTITYKDIVIPKFCPVLGIPMHRNSIKKGEKWNIDNSPSLDRIKPLLGYVPGNTAVISYAANRCKSNFTADQVQKVADYIRMTEQPGFQYEMNNLTAIPPLKKGHPLQPRIISAADLKKIVDVLGLFEAARVASVCTETIRNWTKDKLCCPTQVIVDLLRAAADEKTKYIQVQPPVLTLAEVRAIITTLGGHSATAEASGISQPSISSFDNGHRAPNYEMSARLRAALARHVPREHRGRRRRRGFQIAEDQARYDAEKQQQLEEKRAKDLELIRSGHILSTEEVRKIVSLFGSQRAIGLAIGVNVKTITKWDRGILHPNHEMSLALKKAAELGPGSKKLPVVSKRKVDPKNIRDSTLSVSLSLPETEDPDGRNRRWPDPPKPVWMSDAVSASSISTPISSTPIPAFANAKSVPPVALEGEDSEEIDEESYYESLTSP